MKRFWLFGVLALFGFSLMGGLIGSAEAGVLEIWADDTRSPILEELVPQIQSTFGVPVEITDFGKPEPLREQFSTAAPTGAGPDVLVLIHDQIGSLVQSGLLEPLVLSDSLRAQFTGSALDAFSSGGNLYAIPYATEALVLFYNTDLVPEPPSTFEELLATGAALQASGDVDYAITWNVNSWFFSIFSLLTPGGFIYGSDEGTLNPCNLGLNNAAALEGATWLRGLVQDGLMPAEGVDYGFALSAFKEGRTPFHINGPWEIGGFRDLANFNFATVAIPSINGLPARPFLGVQGFGLSAFSDDKTLGSAFLTDFFALETTQAFFFQRNPRVPAFTPLANDPLFTSDPDLRAVVDSSVNAVPMPNIPEISAMWSPGDNAITLIATSDEPIQDILDNLVETIMASNECEM